LSTFAFTPKRFAMLLFAALIVTFTADRTPAPHRATQPEIPTLYPDNEAIGQDNGSLTESFYLASTPVTRAPERHTISPEQLAPTTPQTPPVRRNYPPLAR
jgi:hypothetical protein